MSPADWHGADQGGAGQGGAGPLRRDVLIAVLAQLALLSALRWGAGEELALGWVGWTVGVTIALASAIVVWFAFSRAGARSLSPADRVTMTRVVLIGVIVALAVDHLGSYAPAELVALSAIALLTDVLDGTVARRTGTVSTAGARFDIEVDSALILVLSAFVASVLGIGVLVIGAMRYLFVASSWMAPWLAAPLPHSRARKVIGAIQGVVLVVVSAGVLPRAIAVSLLLAAIVLLTWSFGRDIVGLFRRRHGVA